MTNQTFDLRFLKNLKQRLTNGNRRSIYLNALPGRRLTRFALNDLDLLEEGLAQRFLQLLFSKANFELKLTKKSNTASNKAFERFIRRLNSTTIENKDYQEEHGTKTFAFGYPIVLRRDAQDSRRIIKAPLFIWSLDIERNMRHSSQWIIRREDDFPISANSVLTAHVMADANMKLYPLPEQFMDDNVVDATELGSLTFEQMRQLNPDLPIKTKQTFLNFLQQPIAPMPNRNTLANMDLKEPTIVWTGIFGLFKSQKESIINDVDLFVEQMDHIQTQIRQQPAAPQGRSAFMKHTFAVVDTDPSQQHLLHALGRGENLILQGPPGTGKSQTLTGIITNALSNGGRCLVVCEKKTALDVLYANLKELGMEELAIVVEDIYKDRRAVVHSVRERASNQYQRYKPSHSFIRSLQSAALQVQRLQVFHNKLMQPLTKDLIWQDVVGRIKELEEFKHPELLKHLQAGHFSFDLEELENILHILKEGEPLFEALGSMNHPFNALSDHFFDVANIQEAEIQVKEAIDRMLYVVDSAQRDILAYLYEYEKELEAHYAEVYHAKTDLTDDILGLIEEGFKKSKYYFNKSGGFGRSMLSWMGGKYKELEEDKNTTLQKYEMLIKTHDSFKYLHYEFAKFQRDGIVFEEIQTSVQAYRDQLGLWYSDIEPTIRAFVNELSTHKAHPHAKFQKKVKEIARNLNLLERNFQKSDLLKVSFRFSSKNLRQRLTDLEVFDKNVQKLKESFDDFRNYHALKFFWIKLTPAQRHAFQGLANAGSKNWVKTFEHWYCGALLAKHEDENIPSQDIYQRTTKGLSKELYDLREKLQNHSLKYWRSKQMDAVQRFHKEKAPLKLNSLYNKRGNVGGRRNPLRRIIEIDPLLFSTFFPVLLVSPSVCASILPLQPNLFDVVIFDEASQLRLEDTFCALIRGRYKVISGDSQQMPPSDYFQSTKVLVHEDEDILDDEGVDPDELAFINESVDYLSSSESLLEYALAEGSFKEEFLQVHYRSKHPYLIDFSNAAFYGNRLSPMPAEKQYKPIDFYPINGVYENYINNSEAQKVIELLIEYGKQPLESCPSVGVATFNIHQRNYILELLQEKAVSKTPEGQAIQRLLERKLFVKNLENIQGDERDIIILSTTFGKRPDDSFIQNYGPLNRERGYRLLNVIVTRAKHKMIVLTSIPEKYYEQFLGEIQENGTKGKGAFYAYLAYARAVSQEDESTRSSILKSVFEYSEQKPFEQYTFSKKEQLFKQQVFNALKEKYADKANCHLNYTFAGFNIPVLLEFSDNKRIALYFDVFHKHPSEEAYAWDMFREFHLTRLGMKCLRAWSHSWWVDMSKELDRLTEAIKEHLSS